MSSNYYESLYATLRIKGSSAADAADALASAFLDKKPLKRGKNKTTAHERHVAFWSMPLLLDLPPEVWATECMVLALARYMAQERYANAALIDHVARVTPEAIRRAARYAGLVLSQHSPRWGEIEPLGRLYPQAFADFVRTFELFDLAHRERGSKVALWKQALAELTPLDLLVHASLYAFEHHVPKDAGGASQGDVQWQEFWDALNALLIWKLTTCKEGELQVTEGDIGRSLKQHLSPFLFPSMEGETPHANFYRQFSALVEAQMELDSFVSQFADELSYNEGIAFSLVADELEIDVLDRDAGTAWRRDGLKLDRLHHYWLYRGMDALAAAPQLLANVGRENLEANLQAFAKAMATRLQLNEVYGLSDAVRTHSGHRVDLFQALLAMELMTVFFITSYLHPFGQYLKQGHDWRSALSRLAFDGVLQPDMQNRFPLTWSEKSTKIKRIQSWTLTPVSPQGSALAAEAILDFWTSDWTALAAQLRGPGQSRKTPELFERPMLKMGRYLFQLPWMVAVQNNATAAINNLRRIGSGRLEERDETRRIELRLGELFAQRGFRVRSNYEPALRDDGDDPGEIDLLCARDGQLLVLEIKSTFMSRSRKQAWIHATSVLRKAGVQLRRKTEAIALAMERDAQLVDDLGLSGIGAARKVTGWIVDTSIECDHQRFNGFLKVSLEEVLIALRDDRHLLNDPGGLLSARSGSRVDYGEADRRQWTLYPDGFTFDRFVSAIDEDAVWATSPETTRRED